jgi:hypothetical protein
VYSETYDERRPLIAMDEAAKQVVADVEPALPMRIVHAPRNGSWLNITEMELSVLTRQCLNRRFESVAAMWDALSAWQTARNATGCGATWRFTTADARIKLKALYPQPEVFE